jgi:hypothetical protein
MSYIFNLIRTTFEWAFFLALVGGLGEATITLYKEAGSARAHGLVSLSQLNRSLVGEETAGLSHAERKSLGSTAKGK